jgi:hypothetical protein
MLVTARTHRVAVVHAAGTDICGPNHGVPWIEFHHDHPRYNDPGSIIFSFHQVPSTAVI